MLNLFSCSSSQERKKTVRATPCYTVLLWRSLTFVVLDLNNLYNAFAGFTLHIDFSILHESHYPATFAFDRIIAMNFSQTLEISFFLLFSRSCSLYHVFSFFASIKKYEDISALIIVCPSFSLPVPYIRPCDSQQQVSGTASASFAESHIQHHLLSQRLFIQCFLRFTIPQVRRTSSSFAGCRTLLGLACASSAICRGIIFF